MKFCQGCGAKLEDDAVFCSECGRAVEDVTTTVKPNPSPANTQNQGNTHGPGIKIEPINTQAITDGINGAKEKMNTTINNLATNQFVLSEGEIIVKEYVATTRILIPCIGRIIVTNKRIIFSSRGIFSAAMIQTPINTVGSITVFSGAVIKLLLIFLGGVGFWFALEMFSVAHRYSGYGGGDYAVYGILLIFISIILIFIGTRKGVIINISAVNSGPGITVGKTNIFGFSLFALTGYAGRDAGTLMNELGAIVLDLQQMGDLAIEKWQNKK